MRNKIIFSCAILLLCALSSLFAQSQVYYKYDASGNRVKRTVIPTMPEPSILTIKSNSGTSAEFTVGGLGKGRIVVIRQSNANEIPELPTNGSFPAAYSNYGNPSAILVAGTTNPTYCVYSVSGAGQTTFTVTNLAVDVYYTVTAYEYYCDEYSALSSYIYNTTVNASNSLRFRKVLHAKRIENEQAVNSPANFSISEPTPNPTSSIINFSLNSTDNGEYKVEVFSESGQTIFAKDYNFAKGDNKANIDFSTIQGGISSGVYLLKVSRNGESLVKKIGVYK